MESSGIDVSEEPNLGRVHLLNTIERSKRWASDVFIYIGDIEELLFTAKRVLENDGLIGFTVESYETDGAADDDDDNDKKKKVNDGFKLLTSGRFGHSKVYIETVAAKAGYGIATWEKCVLRKQGGEPVYGAAVVLKRAKQL